MSYYIINCDNSGLRLDDLAKASAFVDLAAKNIANLLLNQDDSAENLNKIREEYAKIALSNDIADKVNLLNRFANHANIPFEFELDGKSLLFNYTGVTCNWREDKTETVIYAFAPYAHKGSYIGFVGEDMQIWSYVFDGEGSFAMHEPKIDWIGTTEKSNKDWVKFTPESFRSQEDWEEVTELLGYPADEVQSVTIYIDSVYIDSTETETREDE